MKKHNFFPTVRLTDEEKRAMAESFEYITKRGDLPSMPAYKSAMEKMMSLNNYRSNKDSDMIVIPHYPLAMSKEDIRLRYATVSECINEHTELKIKYRSNQSGIKERIIHPYKLYMYNNAWFVLSYCCSTNKIKYFKLNRILEFSKLNSKFDHVYSYREGSKWHEWLDDYGMIHNG